MAGTVLIDGQSPVKLEDYLREILCSGFPGIRSLSPRAQEAQLDGYLDNIVSREFPEQGQMVRKPDVLRNWMRAYATATAGTASYQAILDAATPGEHTPCGRLHRGMDKCPLLRTLHSKPAQIRS